ncbi:MAG TPA: LexA family transcriptional regulator [Thermomicrobiales bacterium]
MSQRELSRRSGKNISTISFTLQGKTWGDKYPPLDDIEAYAKALDIAPAILRGDEPFPEDDPVAPVPEIQTVPLAVLLKRIGAIPYRGRPVEDVAASAGAGSGSQIPQGFDDARPTGKKRDANDPLQDVIVTGDCMVDLLYPGDQVTVDTRQMPQIGDVVVGVRFHDEMIVKFLRMKDEHQYLESKDGKTIIPLDQYIRLLGPVVFVQKSMRRLLEAL